MSKHMFQRLRGSLLTCSMGLVLSVFLLVIVSSNTILSLAHADTTQPDSSGLVQQPDNLAEYIEESIDGEEGSRARYTPPLPKLQGNAELTGEYHQAYYELRDFNTGLPKLDPPPNLQTPLATLEFFNTAMLKKDFGLAAYALNMNSIDPAKQTSVASELTKKLDYLLTEESLYVFDDLPDRADGLIEPPMGSSSSITGIPRRSIKLGYINYQDRHVPIYLERIHVNDTAPIWVFSGQTVSNIDILYNTHKPAEFERYLPHWLTKKFLGISVWEGLALLLFMIITLIGGYFTSKLVGKLISIYTDKVKKKTDKDALPVRNKGLTDLVSKITVPLTITISFGLMFTLVSGGMPKLPSIATNTRPVIWIGLVFSGLWLGIRTINFFANRYQDLRIDSLDDNDEFNQQRVRMTYLSIFRRIFIFVMILGGIWVSLAEFADLEGLGTTLLTSAGIAGAVIGIAAQPTLGNIIAGFQVAVTQPIRIGDTIMLDGVWSEVEDLRYTYAVLKTWDDRRLIVPMKYFVTEVLENWSHTNITQSSAIYLYVDYGADIDAINDKFLEVVKAHELWDKDSEPNMLVSAVTENAIKLRCKVTSSSPANAWTLECDIRKKLLEYLSKNQSEHLPTERITLAPRDI